MRPPDPPPEPALPLPPCDCIMPVWPPERTWVWIKMLPPLPPPLALLISRLFTMMPPSTYEQNNNCWVILLFVVSFFVYLHNFHRACSLISYARRSASLLLPLGLRRAITKSHLIGKFLHSIHQTTTITVKKKCWTFSCNTHGELSFSILWS